MRVPCGRGFAQWIKDTSRITAQWIKIYQGSQADDSQTALIDRVVWHLDVDSSHPEVEEGPNEFDCSLIQVVHPYPDLCETHNVVYIDRRLKKMCLNQDCEKKASYIDKSK